MYQRRILRSIIVLASTLLCLAAVTAIGGVKESEEKLGRDYAQQIEKDLDIVDDKEIVERIQRIGNTLAEIAKSHQVNAYYGSSELCNFKYTFKVVRDDDVNAFAIPGGYIYINTGLIELAESDDEIAGVLAHEIAHVAHHHVSEIIKQQTKVDRFAALAALAAILGNMRKRDLNNLLLGVQMIKASKLSGNTMIAEKDADYTAVEYLSKSPYNLRGLLSFMKKLEAKHEENPSLPLGIYQTHPAPFRRVMAITKAMKDRGIPVDMREMRDIAYAKAVPVSEDRGKYQVMLSNKLVCTLSDLKSGASSKERAESVALKINKALDDGIKYGELTEDNGNLCIISAGKEIIDFEPEDINDSRESGQELLAKARKALAYAAWADWLCATCDKEWEKQLESIE